MRAGVAERLGIQKSQNSIPNCHKSLSDLVAARSDAQPGQFVCVECRVPLQIMESWRRTPDPMAGGNFSTLFCAACGSRLARLGVDVSPTQLTPIDMLNLGIPLQQKS